MKVTPPFPAAHWNQFAADWLRRSKHPCIARLPMPARVRPRPQVEAHATLRGQDGLILFQYGLSLLKQRNFGPRIGRSRHGDAAWQTKRGGVVNGFRLAGASWIEG